MFLWIQGIDGLSQDPRHLREIEIASYIFGQKGSSAVSYGSSQESTSNFEFVKPFDAISPLLHQAATSGKHFATAILTVERNFGGRSGGQLLRVVMNDILVTNATRDSQGASIGDKYESIGLNYASISWKHKE